MAIRYPVLFELEAFMTVGFLYTKDELFEIWSKFSDDIDAVQTLSDFIGRGDNRKRAKELIAEFELIREAHSLGGTLKGKPDRQRKHI